MRWAQLTLVEDDPGKFDLPFWLDYFRRTHSDAACLSAGGCVAYYPTEVPFHHRSRWLGDRDPFGELVAGCRKLGMVVLARTDPHATYDDVREAHPDWIAVDAEGRQRRHWASPEMWVTCALGPYNFEFMTAVHKEIMTRYRVDGIFINRWAGSGMCYCEHCRTNFRAATGHELPRTDDPQDPARRAYILWQQQRLFELWRLWDAEVRKINPDSCVIPNAGGGATSPLDMKTIGELAPTLFADRQARSGLMPPWANGKTAKEYRAAMGRKPVGGHLQHGRGGGVPLERLGAERGGDPHLVRRRGRQRPAALVHQVLRHAPRPALARRRRGPLPLAPPGRTLPAERGAPGPGRPGLLAADRLVLRRPAGQAEGRGPRAGVVPGADRGPDPLRDGPRPAARRRPSGPVQDAHPAEHRRPVGRAVPAAPRVRRPGRQSRGDLRDVALRRVGRATERLRPGGPVRRLLSRPRPRADAERVPAARGRPPHGPAASDPGGPGRRAADHPRDLPAGRHAERASSPTRR